MATTILNKNKKKFVADTWLRENLEYLVEKYPGGYVVIVDNVGLVYTDADGTPKQVVRKAKAKYGGTPLFFRVPRTQDFVCALIVL